MNYIKMKGWVEGMEKVSLTQLQVKYLSMSLKAAKQNVDDVLDGKEVTIKVENEELAREFSSRIGDIGVLFDLETQ